MKRKLIFIFIIMSMIFIPSYQVEAKTLRQLQEELDKLEKAYNENKNKKSLTQSEINTLNSQINTINANIINSTIIIFKNTLIFLFSFFSDTCFSFFLVFLSFLCLFYFS